MSGEESRLAQIEDEGRLRIAMRAIAWTVRTSRPAIEDTEAVKFIEESLTLCEEALQQGLMIPEMPDGHVDKFDELYEGAAEPGVSHFLLAAISCFSFDEDDLSAREVLNILLNCYDGSMLRETEDQITDEFERSNMRAREVIEFQKDLIAGTADGTARRAS